MDEERQRSKAIKSKLGEGRLDQRRERVFQEISKVRIDLNMNDFESRGRLSPVSWRVPENGLTQRLDD